MDEDLFRIQDFSIGEDVEDLSRFRDYSTERNTHILWDLARCPIPTSANLHSVRTSIISALHQMKVYGCEHMRAYGDGLNHSEDDFYNACIIYKPQGEMALDLITGARSTSPRTFMVIPKPDRDSELHRVLKCLQSRHHDLLLVDAPKTKDGLFLSDSVLSVQTVVDCTQGLDGGKPIILGRRLMEDTPPVISNIFSMLHHKFSRRFEGSERNAIVLWDLVKCPVPTYIVNVADDIRAALQRLGHDGCVDILASGADKLNPLEHDSYKEAGVVYTQQEGILWDLGMALHDCPQWFLVGRTFMIIPKPDPEIELHRVLKCLEQMGHEVLLVKPPDDDKDSEQDGQYLDSAQSIVSCTEGYCGGKRIIRGRRRMEETHVIQDFSKRITFVKGSTFGVFWNLEDFPFPVGWSPDDIYKKIQSEFRSADFEVENMSIWAYVDDKEGSWGGHFLKYKTWKSRIYFLPRGGRRDRMFHDINLWALDLFEPFDHFQTYLVIASDKYKVKQDASFFGRLRLLKQRGHEVGFLNPSPTEKDNDSGWLALLPDELYTFAI